MTPNAGRSKPPRRYAEQHGFVLDESIVVDRGNSESQMKSQRLGRFGVRRSTTLQKALLLPTNCPVGWMVKPVRQ